jgi:hypothetical protein
MYKKKSNRRENRSCALKGAGRIDPPFFVDRFILRKTEGRRHAPPHARINGHA